jgi:predicted transcriptional regulator YdeE
MKRIMFFLMCIMQACSLSTIHALQKGILANYSRVSLKPITVVGVELRTTNAEGKSFQDIPAFWKRVQEEDLLVAIPAVIEPTKIYALYTAYPPDGSYAMIIGKQSSAYENLPAGLVSCSIPAGTYAVFTACGQEFALAVGAEWNAIWQLPLDRAFTCDFEVYDAALLSKPIPEVPIYVALK